MCVRCTKCKRLYSTPLALVSISQSPMRKDVRRFAPSRISYVCICRVRHGRNAQNDCPKGLMGGLQAHTSRQPLYVRVHQSTPIPITRRRPYTHNFACQHAIPPHVCSALHIFGTHFISGVFSCSAGCCLYSDDDGQ